MDARHVIANFKKRYPGKNIISLPENNPTEIICEIDPSSMHREYNVAVAAIKKSAPHYHKQAEETYEVISGELSLFVDDTKLTLSKGEQYVVRPNTVHHAEGDFSLVKVTSRPGWTPEDHVLVEV